MRLGHERAELIHDPRDTPAYCISEAARLLCIPTTTLRSWVVPGHLGFGSSAPIISTPLHEPPVLSFFNLVEGLVVRSLRSVRGMPIKDIRLAVRFARQALGIERPLPSLDLCDHLGVEWDASNRPVRLGLPVMGRSHPNERQVVIDPMIGFGRPVLRGSCISTSVIADRLAAGESVDELARDYAVSRLSISGAMRFEART